MISNSRMQITLLSFLFKKINLIIKKGINIKDTLKLYAVLLIVVSSWFPIRKGRRVLKQL
jgi:hypothetical protein